jgi:folate-dependent tRNA-U54 methylase TrmFO/GidA
MNSAFGLLNPLPESVNRGNRKAAYAARALAEIERLEREEVGPAAAAG